MGMSIPINDTSRLYTAFEREIISLFSRVGESGWWLRGKESASFCAAFSRYCGTTHCLPVANGTDALELALRAVLDGDADQLCEVITVANAGGYTSTACRLVGAIPVYVDVMPTDHLVDVESIVRALGPNVRAVVVTHLYGGVADVEEVRRRMDLAGYSQIPIIEDCAQAHGAQIHGKRVGSFGDVATFSFYPTKNLAAMGDGGAITTSSTKLMERLNLLSQYGWKEKYRVNVPYGRNSRMDELQAGVLNLFLPHLDEWNQRRCDIVGQYRNCSGSRMSFLEYGDVQYVAHLAVAQVDERDAFMTFMEDRNIAVDVHYPVLDCNQAGWAALPMRIEEESRLAVSMGVTETIVTLPCFPFMTDEEVERVCAAIREWEQ